MVLLIYIGQVQTSLPIVWIERENHQLLKSIDMVNLWSTTEHALGYLAKADRIPHQLGYLREIGFADVDCYWKWLELALLIGLKPV
jgi:hypothetical protein